jgi:hypothetical protein
MSLVFLFFMSLISGCKREVPSDQDISNHQPVMKQGSGSGGTTLNNGLIAYYPFNGNARDAGPNKFDGIVWDATLAPDKKGIKNKAYSFNGQTSYIYAPGLNQSYFSYNKDFSISLQVFFKNFDNDFPHMLWGENEYLKFFTIGDYQYRNYEPIGNIGFAIFEQSTPYNYGNAYFTGKDFAPLNINTWYNLILVKSGERVSLYINGNFSHYGTFANTSLEIVNGQGMFFGKGLISGFSTGVDGRMDEIRFYNRALTIPEIIQLANN